MVTVGNITYNHIAPPLPNKEVSINDILELTNLLKKLLLIVEKCHDCKAALKQWDSQNV